MAEHDDSKTSHENQNPTISENSDDKNSGKKIPTTSEKTKTGKTKKTTNRNFFALSGELEIGRVEAKVSNPQNMPFESDSLVVDKKGRAFGKASLQVRWEDGGEEIVVLSAKQAELLLKIIKVVPL